MPLAIIAALCVSLVSLIGVFVFKNSGETAGTHRFILPAAVGIFLGVVLFELIPETLEASHTFGPLVIAIGFLGFYLLSHLLHTFHHHHQNHDDACAQGGARLLLVGDGIHNFADGVVIATAFSIDPVLGLATTVGIALHEVPQEVAEFGVLLHAGYTKKKAALYNFLSATSIILGVLVTYLFIQSFSDFLFVITGLAAGNLLYIATADLIPELRHTHKDHFWQTFLATVLGLGFIAVLLSFSH